jgi:protein-disulfide isomerase
MLELNIIKNQLFAILTATTFLAVYFLFPLVTSPRLEFRDRTFPAGFRDLVLDGASSQFDPLFGMHRRPLGGDATKQAQQQLCTALFRDPDSPAVGNRDSSVQIVAFLDYRCPYCKKLTNILAKMQSENVRIVYKEWPILGESSVMAARTALAADKQGKYLEFHNRLMNSRLIPTEAYIDEIVAGLGLNQSQLRTDMNSIVITFAIQNTSALASALGLLGTPALVVGRTIVQGEITQRQLGRLIENEKHLQSPTVCQAS